jgi:hypothetical protein
MSMNEPDLNACVKTVKAWMLTLTAEKPAPFTPEIDRAMKQLWDTRANPVNDLHQKIVYIFEAVLQYRVEADKFSPYVFEKQERLERLWKEVSRRANTLNV